MKGVAAVGLFGQFEPATFLLPGLLALSIALLLWRSHRYLARQRNCWPPGGPPARPVSHPQAVPLDRPDELARWEVRMHETARDLSGQLDSKMGALGRLIQEADRAAARLEAALESASKASDPASVLDATAHPTTELPELLDPPGSQPANQADALKKPVERCRHVLAGAGASKREERPSPAAADRYDEIYLLADYGFGVAEIASRVGSPVGEVELILGLRRRR